MIKETIIGVLVSFAISAVLCPVVIPFLRRLKFGQQVRDDGPQAHLKKSGTPTMGGIVFLISVLCTSLFYIKDYPEILPVLFESPEGEGSVGHSDTYLRVRVPEQGLRGQLRNVHILQTEGDGLIGEIV